MLHLMIGRAGCGKTTQLLHRLVEAGRHRPQILLVPEQQSHEMERALRRAGEEAEGPDGDKLRDLGLICGAYDALAAQIAWDPRDRLTRAADRLRACRWGEGMDFWLDGFTDFTPQQGELLRLLMGRAGAVCPKGEILDRLWGGAEDNNLEAYISFLRKKFFYLGSRASIATLRKVGYRLDDPDRPA